MKKTADKRTTRLKWLSAEAVWLCVFVVVCLSAPTGFAKALLAVLGAALVWAYVAI